MTTTLAYPEAPAEHGRGGLTPHARIVSVNTADASKVPGVHLVLTGADVAGIRFGRAIHDVPILAVEKVRFAGEMVAAPTPPGFG